eukprot:TRINITY_DN20205_c0_g2_i1.p1 TRINITY_DN20205_c0_g2~~TRINITY_DN20205_c0_g2_i1.p1  ORF type:complete len:186 (+),score=54.69 TRINITY_DN20205_c0_g2_i1:61-558(+)
MCIRDREKVKLSRKKANISILDASSTPTHFQSSPTNKRMDPTTSSVDSFSAAANGAARKRRIKKHGNKSVLPTIGRAQIVEPTISFHEVSVSPTRDTAFQRRKMYDAWYIEPKQREAKLTRFLNRIHETRDEGSGGGLLLRNMEGGERGISMPLTESRAAERIQL